MVRRSSEFYSPTPVDQAEENSSRSSKEKKKRSHRLAPFIRRVIATGAAAGAMALGGGEAHAQTEVAAVPDVETPPIVFDANEYAEIPVGAEVLVHIIGDSLNVRDIATTQGSRVVDTLQNGEIVRGTVRITDPSYTWVEIAVDESIAERGVAYIALVPNVVNVMPYTEVPDPDAVPEAPLGTVTPEDPDAQETEAPETDDSAPTEEETESFADRMTGNDWMLPTPDLPTTAQDLRVEQALDELRETNEDWNFEIAQDEWLGDTEVGPFENINRIRFISTPKAEADYGRIVFQDPPDNTRVLPFETGEPQRLSGMDAFQLQVYQVVSRAAGIETKEQFEEFMHNLRPGEYQATMMAYNPETDSMEEMTFDPAMPITFVNMGVWEDNATISARQTLNKGKWSSQFAISQPAVIEDALTIRFWMRKDTYEGGLRRQATRDQNPSANQYLGLEVVVRNSLLEALLRVNVNTTSNADGVINTELMYTPVLGEGVFSPSMYGDELLYSDGRDGVWPYMIPGLTDDGQTYMPPENQFMFLE